MRIFGHFCYQIIPISQGEDGNRFQSSPYVEFLSFASCSHVHKDSSDHAPWLGCPNRNHCLWFGGRSFEQGVDNHQLTIGFRDQGSREDCIDDCLGQEVPRVEDNDLFTLRALIRLSDNRVLTFGVNHKPRNI